ncbi:LysR substrate-binding domain-containing protein [Kineosporia mesophila]|uniref:LysR substrate-binding domain-containing protein n=1 Tax=Kineosporia mesophila TaxID=566012 RepID=A0ABP7AKF7_9ACTN|nr:LysR substrate-binding domain-containing protein [Kineosporia mesophila]MCD5355017.1 LysR family transcriptional regulator [Kineosporia mesophila]
MADLDLRRLRYFVTLAATLNYGQAAQALHIAQPALSRSISTLERELGVTLFERSRAGTKLTAAGELLRDEAQTLLHSAEILQQRLRRADRASLTVGFMPGLILTPLVRHLEERFVGLRVHALRTSWADQLTGLRDGRFDACLAHRPFDDEGLTVVDLFEEPRLVALPLDHPCSGRPEITLADLADDELLQPARAVPGWPGAYATACEAPPSVEEKFEQVAAGRGIVIVPLSASRYYHRPDLAFSRVNDLDPVRVCLVIETRRTEPTLHELLQAAPKLLTSPDAGPA